MADFKRKEGESERAYYSRVVQQVRYSVELHRPRVLALEAYQAGKATLEELEKTLLKAFPKKK